MSKNQIKIPEKLPSGISVRKYKDHSVIRIAFTYQGRKCREYLKNVVPTAKTIEQAYGKKLKIEEDIAFGRFNFTNYFPHSPNIKHFCKENAPDKLRMSVLFNNELDRFERLAKNGKLAGSTLNGYRKIINHELIPVFGDLTLAEVDTSLIKEWLTQQTTCLKTIRNKFSLLKMVFDEAITNEVIEKSPLEQINRKFFNSLDAKKSDYQVEPFTPDERLIILNNCEGQIKNLFQFAFWSGLRTSELIALEWSDIDFENEIINVNKAKVLGKLKTTKTISGIRKVRMLPNAEEALLNQAKYTAHFGREVFFNPNSDMPWSTTTKLGDAWRRILSKLDIKYRNQYQCRHTYASMLLSNGENMLWLSTQMGHVDTEMLTKIYGKWIPQNEKSGYKLIGEY